MSENRPYIDTVEQRNWQLYDVSTQELQLETWEARQARGPVGRIDEGRMYLFAPKPHGGQTLREAYAATQGIGPCLAIHGPTLPEYKALALRFSPRYAYFSRIALAGAGVTLFSPTVRGQKLDLVVLEPTTAQSTFERDFRVVSPEDFQKELDYVDKRWRPKG